MRVLIVDGHSVIFAWPRMRAMHARRTALARDAIIKALTEYQDVSGVHVVAVFDGKGARANEATEPGGIQVFYSGVDQTADDIIERLVAKYAGLHDITVATSDHLEQVTVNAFGASFLSAESLPALLDEARQTLDRNLKKLKKS
ncbi:MAG: NYN domain-containing protein [Chthoniobacteraceae bacterium]|jgi:predicted RNA-binding protein with PIN domain